MVSILKSRTTGDRLCLIAVIWKRVEKWGEQIVVATLCALPPLHFASLWLWLRFVSLDVRQKFCDVCFRLTRAFLCLLWLVVVPLFLFCGLRLSL